MVASSRCTATAPSSGVVIMGPISQREPAWEKEEEMEPLEMESRGGVAEKTPHENFRRKVGKVCQLPSPAVNLALPARRIQRVSTFRRFCAPSTMGATCSHAPTPRVDVTPAVSGAPMPCNGLITLAMLTSVLYISSTPFLTTRRPPHHHPRPSHAWCNQKRAHRG